MQNLDKLLDKASTSDPDTSTQSKPSSVAPFEITPPPAQSDKEGESDESRYEKEPPRKRTIVRVIVFIGCIIFLIVGHLTIPSEVTTVCIDRVQNLFNGVNQIVVDSSFFRNGLEIIYTLFIDLVFLATFTNWTVRGGGSRLIVTTITFYLLKFMIKDLYVNPNPSKGTVWWVYPGMPSLLVSYGIVGPEFFSDHIGIVTICALEWRANNNNVVARIIAVGGVFIAIISMIHKIHYSIDLFVGVTLAHYLFKVADTYKVEINRLFINLYYDVANTCCKACCSKPLEVDQKTATA